MLSSTCLVRALSLYDESENHTVGLVRILLPFWLWNRMADFRHVILLVHAACMFLVKFCMYSVPIETDGACLKRTERTGCSLRSDFEGV